VVVAHNKVRRLKPRVLIVTGPRQDAGTASDDGGPPLRPRSSGGDEPTYIKRGLPTGAYGLDLRDFYLA
jgi:hypothetical protein